MEKTTWTFQKTPLMGGATGEAFVNTLHGSGMPSAAILAREAIQNSVDAWDSQSGEKARVVFRRQSLTGNAKKAFVKTLGLRNEFVSRRKHLQFQQYHCVSSLNDPDEPLHLLYIEDYGTHGLYGHPHTGTSHFFRLLLSLGDSTKSREDGGSGGSYGYGKSVYSANSRIHTIVAYSVFEPKDDKSKHYARLMGCAYFNSHEIEGQSFTGRAWFGVAASGTEQTVDPLHDDDAQAMGEALGFKVRGKKETGTSILIVDCGVDCEELRASIEEWWWPRILDDELGLDIELYEQGKPVPPPRPRGRTDLRPFIHCFEMAIGRTQPAGKHDKQGDLYRWNAKVDLGSFGFSVLDDKQVSDEVLQAKLGRIALIRGPRMVVSYMGVGSLPLPCVGAFVAADSVATPLKISEPASHDKWDPDSTRLLNLKEDDRAQVKAIIDRLKTGMRRFANEAMPPTPKQDARLKLLERLLGNMFKPPSRGTGGDGGHEADPVAITFVNQPHVLAEGAGLRSTGSFRLALADDAEKESARVAVEVECFVVEDEGVSTEDPIPVSVSTNDVEFKADKEKAGRILCRLDRDTKPLFKFRTTAYPLDWTTQIRVFVKEIA